MNNPFIIGDVGINANGDINIAKQLIDMAVRCGCDAVKFQKRTVELCYSQDFLNSSRESPWGKTQREQKMGLEFGKKEYDEINKYCKKVGIEWFASAWDLEAQCFLEGYDLTYNKIASAMLSNRDLVYMIAEKRKHTFISTGLNDWDLIRDVTNIFRGYTCPFTLMHCIMKYPCPDELCKLSIIKRLRNEFNCPVGYSTHNPSILPTSVAVVLGAEAIECHITLDRSSYGSDQAASFEEEGLRRIVRDARRVKPILGG